MPSFAYNDLTVQVSLKESILSRREEMLHVDEVKNQEKVTKPSNTFKDHEHWIS